MLQRSIRFTITRKIHPYASQFIADYLIVLWGKDNNSMLRTYSNIH